MVTSLGDKLLRVVQPSHLPSEKGRKLIICFAGNTIGSKIGVFSYLLLSRYGSGKDSGGYLAKLGTKVNKIAAMELPMPEAMQVAIFLM